MVDEATGGALDFTVDSPSINGEKLEVKVICYFSLASHSSCFVWTSGCNVVVFFIRDNSGKAALPRSRWQRVQNPSELLDNQRHNRLGMAQP